MKKKILLFLLLTFGIMALTMNTLRADISTPKIGQCLNLTSEQYNQPTYDGSYVDCSQSHNFEVYRVILWPTAINPNTVSTNERRSTTNSLCMPWQGNAKFLNDWGYFSPTEGQWNAGMRSVVCVAGVKRSEENDFDFYTWKGSILYVQ